MNKELALMLTGVVRGVLTFYGTSRRDTLGMALGMLGLGILTRQLVNMRSKQLANENSSRRTFSIQKTLNIQAPVQRLFSFVPITKTFHALCPESAR